MLPKDVTVEIISFQTGRCGISCVASCVFSVLWLCFLFMTQKREKLLCEDAQEMLVISSEADWP